MINIFEALLILPIIVGLVGIGYLTYVFIHFIKDRRNTVKTDTDNLEAKENIDK